MTPRAPFDALLTCSEVTLSGTGTSVVSASGTRANSACTPSRPTPFDTHLHAADQETVFYIIRHEMKCMMV